MIQLIKREVVDKHRWVSVVDFQDGVAAEEYGVCATGPRKGARSFWYAHHIVYSDGERFLGR